MPSSPVRLPELLAPAGGPDALKAAVQAGADAVYLGLESLNARQGAENFDLESLAAATRYAHLLGVRVYLTANVLVLESEMRDAVALIADAWEAGVDAVIVQDLGLLRLLRRHLPEIRVHASTQLNAHDSATVAEIGRMGASRVTLAREVSIREMRTIVETSQVEVETFVHGALCFCYSGQCLLSSMIGGRSGNRGRCAQPCRLPYTLLDERGRELEAPGRYLLSPKDLAGIEKLPELVEAGVAALKIEGRMKGFEYVALVTSVYRAALDRLAAGTEGFEVRRAEYDVLEEAFSRGFTTAYLDGVRGDEMMSLARPNNRGVPVGRVTGFTEGAATISLDRSVESADQLEFWTGSGRFAQTAGGMTMDGRAVTSAPQGATVRLRTERSVRKGDRVFRVANAALLEAARRLITPSGAKRRIPATFSVTAMVGRPLEVSATVGDVTKTATGDIVEKARTKPIAAEEVVEHVGRLGETPYEAAGWTVQLDPSAGLGYSALHRLRADVLRRLDEARLAPWQGRRPSRPEPALPTSASAPSERVVPELVVACADLDIARACLREGADRVLLSVDTVDQLAELPAGVQPLLPRIAKDAELPRLMRRVEAGPAATAGTLGVLHRGAEAGLRMEADWPLNAMNPWSVEALAEAGASLVWASPELSGRQLTALTASSPVPVGVVVFGRLELMVAEHCVIGSTGGCDRRCAACERRLRSRRLRDQKDYEFPVRSDAMGRTHIYNSVTLDLSRALDEVLASGVAAVRLEFHTERIGEALELLRSFKRLIRENVAGRPAPEHPLVTPSTSGHFFRGVK